MPRWAVFILAVNIRINSSQSSINFDAKSLSITSASRINRSQYLDSFASFRAIASLEIKSPTALTNTRFLNVGAHTRC